MIPGLERVNARNIVKREQETDENTVASASSLFNILLKKHCISPTL
jgi:hypothetical protein